MSRPHHDACAPSIEPGVIRRLARLDRDLFVTWSPWALDPLTGQIIETTWGEAIPQPGFTLWLKSDTHGVLFVGEYEHFGHREVQKLEGDIGRHMPHASIGRHIEDLKLRRKNAKAAQYRDYGNEKWKANKRRMADWIAEEHAGRRTERQARIVSGAGGTRATPGNVPMTPAEQGWDIPQTPQL